MPDSKVTVFASFTPNEGQEAEVAATLGAMVAPTRGEPGCQCYDLYKSTDDLATFHLFEIYDDQAALDHHRTTGHYKAYRAAIADLLAAPIGVKILTSVDVAG